MQQLLVVNGPNLNLLGTREPETYGSTTLGELEALCARWGADVGFSVETFQSNHEGDLIDRLQQARGEVDGIVFNPGAFTHTSYALADTLTAIQVPTVETHISNVLEREPFRRISLVRPACVSTVYGRGIDGYRWAIRHLAHRAEWPFETVAYGDSADQVVDIRRPDGGRDEAIVLLHGGFWRHMWTRDLMDGIAVDLTRRGWVTANVEYRRVGAGGGWPDTLSDVEAAIRGVSTLAGVERVTVLGHSAGGHLAVCGAAAVGATRAVSLAGVLDLEWGSAHDVGGGAIDAFVGSTGPAAASATTVAPDVDAIAIHGADDEVVPVEMSRRYAGGNPRCTLIELRDVGHFEFLERSDPAWETVVEALENAG